MNQEITWLTAFVAGFLSFLSPCVLPLVPAYLSFMTGLSLDHMRATGRQKAFDWHAGSYSLVFVAGFSLVFIVLGASAFAMGQILLQYMPLLAKIGGVLIILFGLHFMGVFRVGWFNLEARFNPQHKPPGLSGAFLIGLTFAFGWTPCIGPILAGILALAGGQESVWQGVALLTLYSLGLGVPFVIAGLAINRFLAFFGSIRRHLHRVEWIAGALLVVIGTMIFIGHFNQLSVLLLQWFPSLATLG
ncbi:MAG: cytochrome c biogenesis protein CcdA [Magnetococcales bacterium]|nr:cytochrome c biogenesis protein CcdA [Magnetococcales bacterium]